MEGAEGHDLLRKQLVDQPVVKAQPASVTAPVPCGSTRGHDTLKRSACRPKCRISAMSCALRATWSQATDRKKEPEPANVLFHAGLRVASGLR